MYESSETTYDSEPVSWSPLMIVVGVVLQFVMQFFVSFVVLLIPSLASAAVHTVGKVTDTFMWLGGLSSFFGALAVLFLVRRRFKSTLVLLMHTAVPAMIVVSANMISTVSLRGWIGFVGSVAIAALGGAGAAILYILLLRFRSSSDFR
ncbi:hypothetical protein [Actinomyces naeslundii]|uniref:Uncharacterized protein n=1 Tax=Actinomyces naeslundii TaxID=1655 RepID=A0AA47FGP9_ACTNA|nr:hypothetical protein [Actinomyces naeslundii]WAL42987.1 hypothetical protein OFA60_13300 [Actinomyces naeslundii]